jgi:hypothetical protein
MKPWSTKTATVRISKATTVSPDCFDFLPKNPTCLIIRVDFIDEENEPSSFIDNDLNSTSLDDAVVGWMDWKATQDSADALLDIARDIQRRYSDVDVDDESTLSRAPVLGDPSIWRIKVKVCDVVKAGISDLLIGYLLAWTRTYDRRRNIAESDPEAIAQ